ncbi:MAG: bifunctional molybdenum cofactor biosynthesis protein MoaC/MoaB [Flavitalea sp.]
MRDVSHKQITLRTAQAVAVVYCSETTIQQIRKDELPKGNLFDVARAAAFIGAKSTPMLLPHCHPVSIDGMDIRFEWLKETTMEDVFNQDQRPGIVIIGEAKSIGRTGIEMEILTGVSVAALEIYDMLKPVDTTLEIGQIKLLKKTGGKSDRSRFFDSSADCAILVCSDSTAAGTREDESGIVISKMLEEVNATVKYYDIVPDDKVIIQQRILKWVKEDIPFIFTTGGTGLGPRDNTVEAVREIIERDADGITEAMRHHGQMRTPLAMMSRAIAGSINHTLIVTLPGSTKGAKESLEAILPAVFHARKMMLGGGH